MHIYRTKHLEILITIVTGSDYFSDDIAYDFAAAVDVDDVRRRGRSQKHPDISKIIAAED